MPLPYRHFSLRSRIYTVLIVGIVLSIAAGAWMSLRVFWPRYLAALELSLYDSSALVAALIERHTDRFYTFTESLSAALDSISQRRQGPEIEGLRRTPVPARIYVCDRHGVVLYDSYAKAKGQDYSQWRDVARTLKGEYGARTSRLDPFSPGELWLYAAAPIRVDTVILGVVSTGSRPAAMAALFRDAAKSLIVFAVLLALVLAWVGMGFTLWFTRPIEKLTAFATTVAKGENAHLPRVSGRVALGSSEFDTLGRSLERMREGLEGRAYVERYVENLVHSLKGPVSGIINSVELMSKESVTLERNREWAADIGRKIALINRATDELLDQMKLENRAVLPKREKVAVERILKDAVHIRQAEAELKGVDLQADAAVELWVAGDYSLLLKAVNNLVENALAFTLTGGSVRLKAQKQGAWVRIVVEDTGCGIPAESLNKIFDKYYSLPRPDTHEASSGLGLGFVKELARLYEGEIEVKNRGDAEHGVRAVLSLPIRMERG
jgi:two-component system sensor histidine kinase CreC